MDCQKVIASLRQAIAEMEGLNINGALAAIAEAQIEIEGSDEIEHERYDDEPHDIDGDDYWVDHDPFGGGSMMIGGDSDLMNEC